MKKIVNFDDNKLVLESLSNDFLFVEVKEELNVHALKNKIEDELGVRVISYTPEISSMCTYENSNLISKKFYYYFKIQSK